MLKANTLSYSARSVAFWKSVCFKLLESGFISHCVFSVVFVWVSVSGCLKRWIYPCVWLDDSRCLFLVPLYGWLSDSGCWLQIYLCSILGVWLQIFVLRSFKFIHVRHVSVTLQQMSSIQPNQKITVSGNRQIKSQLRRPMWYWQKPWNWQNDEKDRHDESNEVIQSHSEA